MPGRLSLLVLLAVSIVSGHGSTTMAQAKTYGSVTFARERFTVDNPQDEALARKAIDAAEAAVKACDSKAYDAALSLLGGRIIDLSDKVVKALEKIEDIKARRPGRRLRRTDVRDIELEKDKKYWAKAREDALEEIQTRMIEKKRYLFARCEHDKFIREAKERGLIVEPLIAFGLGNDTARGNYRSTGAQALFRGSAVNKAQSALMAGADILVPLSAIIGDDPLSRATAGQFLTMAAPLIGLGLRSGLLFQNDKVTYDIVRHGADGRVRLSERELANVGLYVMFGLPISIRIRRRPQRGDAASSTQLAALDQVAALPALPSRLSFLLYGGVGPTFTNTKIDMRSNKVPGGGVFTSTSKTSWDTGLGVVAGIRAALCRACAFGHPLRLGFEWQGRWMPERNVATSSPTFGFTESGRVHSRFSQEFMLTLSVPFTIGLH